MLTALLPDYGYPRTGVTPTWRPRPRPPAGTKDREQGTLLCEVLAPPESERLSWPQGGDSGSLSYVTLSTGWRELRAQQARWWWLGHYFLWSVPEIA